MKPQVVTALYQRHSAILGQFLLGHQPLEAEIDLRQRPNPPLETEVGTPRSETGPCDCANALWQRLLFTYSMQKRHEKKPSARNFPKKITLQTAIHTEQASSWGSVLLLRVDQRFGCGLGGDGTLLGTGECGPARPRRP